MLNRTLRRLLVAGASLAALSACNGANDVASPGNGGNITINNPAPSPSPSPSPTPTPTAQITPASGCPTIADPQGLTDNGTITNPTTGTYRVCALPTQINASINLPYIQGVVYELPGRVDVGTDGGPTASNADTDVTLSIEPGVVIYGGTGVSWLAVNRGNKINAVGTADKPIVFTSRDNILGLNTDSSSGQWGGVVLMGRAQVTDCQDPAATPGTTACERQTEGAVDPALYGGNTNDDDSGVMDYVQIRYSGYVLSADSELQSLTPEGVGSKTRIGHFMSFNSSDDAIEMFGGHPRVKHMVSVGAEDDNLDSDTGTKAHLQYVLVVQRQGIGDAMIEADTDNSSDGDTPRQNTKLANFTFIDRSPNNSDQASILLRGGTDYTMVNGVLSSADNPCLRISRTQTASTTANAAIDEAGAPVFRSVVMTCGTPKYIGSNGVTAAEVEAIFGSGKNNNDDSFTLSLTNLFVNGANENAVTPFDAATLNDTGDTFFETTDHIGAVKDANDTWYQGWTCSSATVDFGGGESACSSLPVYDS
ncbi:hypothetical protein GCM10023219_15690 [Stakelama sediminis]|uniref:Secreted protein n=1 Tax=Stakelama sediminis TaxID=463200 RepID=A0A840YXB5_9SPHN|nr:hypothetical protein [Stakelama sediminis]MBB5718298.1 hypothetical protein [Stakelama sediminis]